MHQEQVSDNEQEIKWCAEFNEAGEREIRARLSSPAHMNHEPQRQYAFRWLREQEEKKRVREQQMYSYARWTLWAAVAAVVVSGVSVVVGVIGALVTWLH